MVQEILLRSDNCAGAAPEILKAVVSANEGYLPSYGSDSWSGKLAEQFARLFGREIAFALVASGTGANALALSVVIPPEGVVLCHENAHIRVAEQGAVEFFTGGAKLVGVPGAHGKIDPHALKNTLSNMTMNRGAVPAPKCLSLTQLTEAGTAYSLEELKALVAIAREHGVRIHLDGARIANAIAASEYSISQLFEEIPVDVLSFGATKNGALTTDAVILFDDALRDELAVRQKRSGHVFSKQRFLAAQWQAYLKGDLWLKLAHQANNCAQVLARDLAGIKLLSIGHSVDGNIVFVTLPQGVLGTTSCEEAPFYILEPDVIRLVTAYNTSERELVCVVTKLKQLCATAMPE